MTQHFLQRSALALVALSSLSSCYSPSSNGDWASVELFPPPQSIADVFAREPDDVLWLRATDPGKDYQFDPSEKDSQFAGDESAMRFRNIEMKLHDTMPLGTVLVDIAFIDDQGSKVEVGPIDLMRLTPRLESQGEMQFPEMLLEEYERFGVVFRREHGEFKVSLSPSAGAATRTAVDRTYRLGIWNNCLDATKWEMVLFTEDYRDFDARLAGTKYVNQQRTLSHNWFYMEEDLYRALIQVKNPGLEIDPFISYDELSDRAEEVVVDLKTLRTVKRREAIEVEEIGHLSGRDLKPVNPEQFFKWESGLILNQKDCCDYSRVLDQPMSIAQFGDSGFYKPQDPKEFDYGWLRDIDDVELDILEVPGSDCYAQITLAGKGASSKIVLGNVDLAQIDEQSFLGLAFGINPYPKLRRHTPQQDTIRFEPDRMPGHIKPYLLMMDSETGHWINNQKAGLEKVLLSWTSINRDELAIYLVTYERILAVWMARVRLGDELVDRIRVRRRLYNYR
jgi:hypothetical protein